MQPDQLSFLGFWQGSRDLRCGWWLRWWNAEGELLLWPEEIAQQEKENRELAQQQAQQERHQRELAQQQAQQERHQRELAQQQRAEMEKLLAQYREQFGELSD